MPKNKEKTVSRATGAAAFGAGAPDRQPPYKKVSTQSIYLTMRDGVKLAIDISLPKELPAGEKIPALLIMARYWRSFALRPGTPPNKAPMGPRRPIEDYLVRHGYAVIRVDVRGSGASFGTFPYPWSQTEITDFGEVVEWAIKQSWSNGRAGAIGYSYEGTAAELLATAHPAVKAVIPQQIEFDLFTDITFPGGIFNRWFVEKWQETNTSLDRNIVPKEWGFMARLMVKGVRPVDDDAGRKQLKQAIEEHRSNTDVYKAVENITYRDDPFGTQDVTLDDMSVYRFRDKIETSNAAILGWGSWMDSCTAHTVLRRFTNIDRPQCAVIGAWNHTGETHGSPYCLPKKPAHPPLEVQWLEARRFLDHYLKDTPDRRFSRKTLFYYTLGKEQWQCTTQWPPAGTVMNRWYLVEMGNLSPQPPGGEKGKDNYTVDFEAGTGKTNRWHTSDGMSPVIYRDRSKMDGRLLTYTGPMLKEDTEITGYPTVTLYISSTAVDGSLFVYLEDVDECGEVHYVTEGMLRVIHHPVSADPPPYRSPGPYHSFKRKDAAPLKEGVVTELSFALLPTSVVIRKGHRIRIAVAGHDKDTFRRIPEFQTPVITLFRNKTHASFIDIPVISK